MASVLGYLSNSNPSASRQEGFHSKTVQHAQILLFQLPSLREEMCVCASQCGCERNRDTQGERGWEAGRDDLALLARYVLYLPPLQGLVTSTFLCREARGTFLQSDTLSNRKAIYFLLALQIFSACNCRPESLSYQRNLYGSVRWAGVIWL